MMQGSVRTALVAAGAAMMAAAPGAAAQRPLPRIVAAPPHAPQRPVGRAAEAPPRQVPDPRFPPSANDPRSQRDPRFPQSAYDPRYNRPSTSYDPRYDRPSDGWDGRRQRPPRSNGSTVIILPVPSGYGYGYGYGRGYYPPSYGGVYDVDGRPLSTSLEPVETDAAVYTPDLTGSPYRITNEGMMVVDFADGARRAFPSCAGQSSVRDPQGRPRTIFYQPSDYWMVLKPGQRGRVHGAPDKDAVACYAIDSAGRVVLRN